MDLSDTEDLEALFDQTAAQVAASAAASHPSRDMFQRVGALTRQLHDALLELGIGDAQSRLQYIARLTGEAAEKVLTAVEKGQSEMSALDGGARVLHARWERVFSKAATPEELRETALETRAFFAEAPQRAERTRQELHAIMMAQDFHDLTGQVIQRTVKFAETLEVNLVRMLVEATPADKRPAISSHTGFLSGPAMNAGERTDVVADQAQVDELLASLGF